MISQPQQPQDAAAVISRHLPEALAFLRELVSSNSWTLNPSGVRANARLIVGRFAALGFSAEHVPSENPAFGDHLFLRRPGAGRRGLLLVSHLDTVFPPEEEARNDFRWLEEGDRIYGPGVIDIKGGTAMIWLVLAALREIDPILFDQTDWLIALNAAEEELSPDFPKACKERLPANTRAALIFEACAGQGPGYSLVRARKGSANLRITVEGRGAHAGSRHQEGANAVIQAAALIQQTAALTDYSRKLTVNVGSVRGGGPINRVPHECEFEVNIRAFDNDVLQEAVDRIYAYEQTGVRVRAASDGYPCRVKVETMSRNPAWPASGETGELISIWQAAAAAEGIALDAEERGGLSDGNYISQFLPTLDGLGLFGRNGHASERNADGTKVPEYAVRSSLTELARVNLRGIRALL
jgi:glutamate carboxypeptidase